MEVNSDEILEKTTKFLATESEVSGAIAFGSVVTDHFASTSDVDLALIAQGELTEVRAFELRQDLEALLKRDVHLVVLSSSLSLVLRNDIARNGRLLFAKDRSKSDHFFIKTPQLYFDLMQTRKPLEDKYLKERSK